MKVRDVFIKYGTTKKRNLRKEQEEIEISITTLEEQLTHSDVNDKQKKQIWCDIEGKKRELERIIEYQTKGAILRSKSRWYNEGEKNTKYFLNLEKRHCKQATITQLKVSEDDFISTDKEILLECENFYKNLYTSKVDTKKNADAFFPPLEEQKRLSQEEQSLCEGPLSKKECLEALKSMASEKTPGSDGLPCEFYKVFWNDLAEILLNALNFSFETGQLSISQRRGIVKLIPKKDAELILIKNWRPLTLLNCDYKIASKAIASRIKTFLPKLISDDQTGFLKGRCISENIRLLDIVIKYTEGRKIPGLLLFIDFEKAFDTLLEIVNVSYSFLEQDKVTDTLIRPILRYSMLEKANLTTPTAMDSSL